MKKWPAIILILLIVMTMMAGCQKQKPQNDKTKLTVTLDWTPNTNHTGLYVAQSEGFYNAQGLEVDIIQPGEAGALGLVGASKAQFAVSYQEEVILARAQGVPVVAVAAIIQHNTSGFAAPVDRGIKSPADFAGKRYGGWGGPSEQATLDLLMTKAGKKADTISMVNIGTTDFFAAVRRDIDFSWIYWGWTGIEAEQRGMKLDYIPLKDLDPVLDYYTPVLVANEKWLQDNPETARHFLAATSQGYNFSRRQPEAAADILLQAAPELNPELVKASQRYLGPLYQAEAPRWGEMRAVVWERYADWLYKNGVLKEPLPTNQAFTNDYLPSAN
ncbi:MAG: ABC transporter substrate-binding protein [Methanomassiliicoccales archaeon]